MRIEPLTGTSLGSPDGSFVVVEWTAEVGKHWIAPLHLHRRDDEAWYVLEGALGFLIADDEIEAPAGSGVFVPRGTPHTYWNAAEAETRYLLVMTPLLAQLVEAVHEPGADVPALFAAHESELLAQA